MTRQDLNGKLYAEVESVLGEELNKYIEKVNEVMTIEDLEAMEQELMEEAKEYDALSISVSGDYLLEVIGDGKKIPSEEAE